MFCSNCGNEVTPNSKFCPHCGDAVDLTAVPTENVYQQQVQPKAEQYAEVYQQSNMASVEKTPEKKKNKMMIAGIVLLCLQVVGTLSGMENGDLANVFASGKIPGIIGYFLLGIIGVVLIIIAKKKQNQ